MTPFQELKQGIRKVHPQARVYGYKLTGVDLWNVQVVFNAITDVTVTGFPTRTSLRTSFVMTFCLQYSTSVKAVITTR